METEKIRSLLCKTYSIKEDLERLKKIEKARNFCTYLEQNGIKYDICIKHKEVLGCDESSLYYQRFEDYLCDDYSICKHLLVRERKGEKRTFLIVTDSSKQVDLSSIREELDCKKLEFVKEDDMKELINTTPGNVSIFNMIYDHDKKVNLVFDEDLLSRESLAFHPLYNGMSLFLKPKECLKYVGLINRDISTFKVPEKTTSKVVQKTLAS